MVHGALTGSATAVVRNRVLATLLGLAMTASLAGAFVYWQQTYVHGVEICANCGASRDASRYGPFWFRSESRMRAGGSVPSEEHTWERAGCWVVGGSYAHYAGPRRR